MFLLRLNQNINTHSDITKLKLYNNARIIFLKYIEYYCLKRNVDNLIVLNIILRLFNAEWVSLCTSKNIEELRPLLKKSLVYYNNLTSPRLINYINFDYEVSYNFLFSYGVNILKSPTWHFNMPVTLHLVRTQRRYNKRRYARVRAVSRPSFWFGALLGSIGLGLFWGATMQLTDWITTQIIVVDINALLIIIYTFLTWRLCSLVGRGSYYVVRGNTFLSNGYQTIAQHNLNNAKWW